VHAAIATRNDAIKFAALQEDHPARQAAMSNDPAPNRSRINIPEGLCAERTCYRPAIAVGHPGGMKAEARTLRSANPVMRNQAQHQRASRQAISVDDNAFAGRTQ